MKSDYYTFITSKGISDTLSYLTDIPYSKKHKILENLYCKFSVDVINNTLREYQTNYINLHRVRLNIVENVLIGLCKKQN